MPRMKSLIPMALALGLVVTAAYAGTTATGSQTTPAQSKVTSATHATTHSYAKHARMTRLDVNSATKDELMKLKGINEATADKIIAGRPWSSKMELVNKGVLTKEEWREVSAHLTVREAAAAKHAK